MNIFKSARYKWLVDNKNSDPKLQQLYDNLSTAWNKYLSFSDELNYLYTTALPVVPTTPWD